MTDLLSTVEKPKTETTDEAHQAALREIKTEAANGITKITSDLPGVGDITEPEKLFTDKGINETLTKIEAAIKNIPADISTKKGRDTVKSTAYSLARMKTQIDDMGKTYVGALKLRTSAIDAHRRKIWDSMEVLQKQVRQPLTEWEEKEENRVKDHQERIERLKALDKFETDPTAVDVQARIDLIPAMMQRDWEEFTAEATTASDAMRYSLGQIMERIKKREEEQAELQRLRDEAAQRERDEAARRQREHEEKIAREAAEKARLEEQEKQRKDAEEMALAAERERQRLIREKEEEEQRRIAAEKQAAEEKRRADEEAAQRKRDAEEAARREEQQKRDNEDRLRREREESDRRAKQAAEDAEAAKKKAAEEAAAIERDRQDRERREAELAEQKRKENMEHQRMVNGAIVAALLLNVTSLTEDQAKAVVRTIVNGLVPNTTIRY